MNPNEIVREITPFPRLIETEYNFEARWESFLRIAKTIRSDFDIDEENKTIYQETCRYFAGDQSCIYDLNKGLYLYSDVGTGKTLFFKIFNSLNKAVNSPNNFKGLTVNDLIDGYSKHGSAYWTESGINKIITGSSESYYRNPSHFFIDDLGQSSRTASYFGSNIDVVSELIQRRYYAYTDNYVLTHASSNIPPSEIKKTYGKFTSSRMREMFNIILFPGEDRRI